MDGRGFKERVTSKIETNEADSKGYCKMTFEPSLFFSDLIDKLKTLLNPLIYDHIASHFFS
jgi:hypothetical protein